MNKDAFKDFCNNPDLPKKHREICDGTSGLGIDKELFYLGKLTQTEPPGLFQQGINFIKSTAHHFYEGLPNTTDELKRQRLDICGGCDKFVKESSQCIICGCYMELKAGWLEQQCPLGLWPSLETQKGPPSEDSSPKPNGV